MKLSMQNIAEEINNLSKNYDIGELQNIRKKLHRAQKLASKNIFDKRTISDNWAFHYGGRKELQFNIGLETINDRPHIRFGVAFSLELSQSLPKIDILIPKIALFNEYLYEYLSNFSNMKMWYYQNDEKSSEYVPSIIPDALVKKDIFIFLGIVQPYDDLNYNEAIQVMNRLLPLYIFTETNQKIKYNDNIKDFCFTSGCTKKLSSTTANLAQKKLNISLRHNDIQSILFDKLSKEYGTENVGTEIPNGQGGYIDLVVKDNKQYHFYEIKTAHTAKSCIRQAIGQLLEYAYWSGNIEISNLIIIGEAPIDSETETYIKTLKSKFSLPIKYESIQL